MISTGARASGPRADGFYFGNDINTIHELVTLFQVVKEYRDGLSDPSSSRWDLVGSDQEGKQQKSMKERRTLVYDAMTLACSKHNVEFDDVVKRLDYLLTANGNGISRAETWARDAKKVSDHHSGGGTEVHPGGQESTSG